MNQNTEEKNMLDNSVFTFNLSKKDIDVLYKYLSRVDLKGVEVPEFNYIINLFDIKNG